MVSGKAHRGASRSTLVAVVSLTAATVSVRGSRLLGRLRPDVLRDVVVRVSRFLAEPAHRTAPPSHDDRRHSAAPERHVRGMPAAVVISATAWPASRGWRWCQRSADAGVAADVGADWRPRSDDDRHGLAYR